MNRAEKKTKKEFDTVAFFRKVKEKISEETKDMTFEQFKEYLRTNKLKISE